MERPCNEKVELSMEKSRLPNRTRANKGRSILEAAHLRNQAKTHFLCVFYVMT